MYKFIYHNIRLNDGTETNSKIKLLSETSLWLSIAGVLGHFIKYRRDLTAIDLGCFEGGYTVELGHMGFNTVGIEARKENIDKANYVRNNLSLPIKFVQDDVRNLLQYSRVDAMLCAGLLYHLDDPVAMLRKMAESTKQVLIIITHFALERSLLYDLGDFNRYILAPILKGIGISYIHNYRLSKLTYNEGYRGRWYKEYSKRAPKEKIEKAAPAAYNNNRSFWLCKGEIVKVLSEDFSLVYEQPLTVSRGYSEYDQTCMIVAIK